MSTINALASDTVMSSSSTIKVRSALSIASGNVSQASTTRSIKAPPPGLLDKRMKYRVVDDDVDVTPDNLEDPDYYIMEEYNIHAAFDTKPRYQGDFGIAKKTETQADSTIKFHSTTINLDDIQIDPSINTEEGVFSGQLEIDREPSQYYLASKDRSIMYQSKIKITLKESLTTHLFSMPGSTVEKGTNEANIVEAENDFYTYITVGKGRNRRMVNEETQTQTKVSQTRHTIAVLPETRNAISFASVWDMQDTYQMLANQVKQKAPDEMVMYQAVAPELLRAPKVVELVNKTSEEQFEELAKDSKYLDAVMLADRVLAAKEYGDMQTIYRGLSPMDPFSQDLVYYYTLKSLWSLECEETAGHPISCVDFNPRNKDIVAVGYGRFGCTETHDGMILIWCTKNPCGPERMYRFDIPLTTLKFSNKKPNWLGCGFSNGDVAIIDISSHTISIVAKSKRDTNPSFEQIWSMNWRLTETNDAEYLITSCQDGRISRFTNTKTNDFFCTPMMRVTSVEGKTKGVEVTKSCMKVDVPIVRYPAALCMKWHATVDHIYYVGTDEGCIHRCSKHYLNQHMDVFRAHAGPVYNLEQSPFMKSLLMSCGADGAIRLWIEGIDDVILTMMCNSAVYDVAFCPLNSTIIVSVNSNVLSIWDIRRKTHMPCAEYTFPGNYTLTYVTFSAAGDSIFVADTGGKIQTYHLEDTPIPPYYQHKLLDEAILKALCTRPQLIKQLNKLKSVRNEL